MATLPALRAAPLGDCFRPGVTASEQIADFRPRAPWAQPLYGGLLDRVEGLVARCQFLAGFESGAALHEQVVYGCNFGDFRLQGFRERICHEARVEATAPVLN